MPEYTSVAKAGHAMTEPIRDHNAAAKVHIPNSNGSINRKVAAELIRMGWRKMPN
jgi:hypothetical protein